MASWWHRNRFVLALIIPLAAVAVAASSYRLTTFYLDVYPTRITVAPGTSHRFVQDWTFDKDTYHRAVDITLTKAEPVTEVDGTTAPTGARLWRVEFQLAASPDTQLRYCTIELLDADGVRYGTRAGKLGVNPPLTSHCVPDDTPGPSLMLGKLVPGEGIRSSTWPATALIAVPADHRPELVRIYWDTPEGVAFKVPA